MNDIHASVGLYVTAALEGAEEAAFVEHLPNCSDCRRQVDEFSETLARLAELDVTPPPAGLRGDVLAAVSRIRPEPPPPRVAVEAAPATGSADVVASRARPARPWWQLALVAITIFALGAVAGGVVTAVVAEQRAESQRTAAADRVVELVSAPDVSVSAVTLADGTRGSWTVSRELDRGMFTADGLADSEPGKAYQLWTIVEGVPQPGEVFAGGTDVQVWFSGLASAEAVAVTVEPEGGSAQPTSPVMGLAELPA